MQDLEPPPAVAMPITGTLSEIPARNAARWPQRAMYSLRTPDGWSEVTARQFHEQVRGVARGIVARGIEVGEPVAILSPTRYEWTVLDFALWSAGAFAVPIYDMYPWLEQAASGRRGGTPGVRSVFTETDAARPDGLELTITSLPAPRHELRGRGPLDELARDAAAGADGRRGDPRRLSMALRFDRPGDVRSTPPAPPAGPGRPAGADSTLWLDDPRRRQERVSGTLPASARASPCPMVFLPMVYVLSRRAGLMICVCQQGDAGGHTSPTSRT